jgi:sensor histidine kinase regulating citrate/malate metabolism
MGLVFTPHPMVSSILSYCRQRANRIGADLLLDVSVPSFIDVNQIDLTVIMGNTIDNALEALEDVVPAQRKLHISLRQSEFYLFYEITNTYDFTVAKKSYENRTFRGYGLRNVRSCVDKYGGSFNVNDKKGEYTVTIMIPCQVKKQDN